MTLHYSNYLEKKRVKSILTYFLLVNVCINVFCDGDLIRVLLGVIGDDALTMYLLVSYYYWFVIDNLTLVINLIVRRLGIVLYFLEVIFDDSLISGLDLTDVLGS
jgi:hypothetical protein